MNCSYGDGSSVLAKSNTSCATNDAVTDSLCYCFKVAASKYRAGCCDPDIHTTNPAARNSCELIKKSAHNGAGLGWYLGLRSGNQLNDDTCDAALETTPSPTPCPSGSSSTTCDAEKILTDCPDIAAAVPGLG